MANCPKCGHKLSIFNVSQYCPKCGVNIMYANFEPQFQKDRRIAEMSLAGFHINVEKFKSAFVSGLPQKLKIAAAFLPLAAVVIPFGSLGVNTPIYSDSVSFGAIDLVYSAFFGGDLFSRVSTLAGTEPFGGIASLASGLMLCFLAAAAFAALILVDELICFIGNKKSSIAMAVFGVGGIASLCAAAATAFQLKNACAEYGDIFTCSVNPLFIAGIVLFAATVFVALWNLKNPPVRNYQPEDVLRDEYRKKYKAGKIALLDIPAPIAETESERAEKEKLIRQAYNMDEGEAENDG